MLCVQSPGRVLFIVPPFRRNSGVWTNTVPVSFSLRLRRLMCGGAAPHRLEFWTFCSSHPYSELVTPQKRCPIAIDCVRRVAVTFRLRGYKVDSFGSR
jgi:hypothetical protein